MADENKKADKESGLEDALESEAEVSRPVVEKTGGVRTTDPNIQEVKSKPRNLKTPK